MESFQKQKKTLFKDKWYVICHHVQTLLTPHKRANEEFPNGIQLIKPSSAINFIISSTSEVTTVWRYRNSIIIIITLNMLEIIDSRWINH